MEARCSACGRVIKTISSAGEVLYSQHLAGGERTALRCVGSWRSVPADALQDAQEERLLRARARKLSRLQALALQTGVAYITRTLDAIHDLLQEVHYNLVDRTWRVTLNPTGERVRALRFPGRSPGERP